jgi:hypothetical protein
VHEHIALHRGRFVYPASGEVNEVAPTVDAPADDASRVSGAVRPRTGSELRAVLPRGFRIGANAQPLPRAEGADPPCLSSELPVYYPGEEKFAPDLIAVLDAEPHARLRWVVAEEGKGLTFAMDVTLHGSWRKSSSAGVASAGPSRDMPSQPSSGATNR